MSTSTPNDSGMAETTIAAALGAAMPAAGIEKLHAKGELLRQLTGRAPEPVKLARYVLLDRLGAGATGIVYRAHDPELNRRVAVKLLQSEAERDADRLIKRRSRLLREGQAAARVDHPNVIDVYDVGSYAEWDVRRVTTASGTELPSRGVFLVMELIEGTDLKTWLADEKPRWREVIRVMVHAGKGLAAAHDQGLIHRDFKPANVMLSSDGGVRVLDFGLARMDEEAPETTVLDTDSVEGPPEELAKTLTATGALMGTPAYMSPEQHDGRPNTAAGDQFSYCASVYEALYGVCPFSGDTVLAQAEAKEAGAIRPIPSRSPVPRAVLRVLRRGLSPSPDERWPSMRDLLSALERAAKPRRKQVAAMAAAALAVGAIGAAVALPSASPGAPCPDAAQMLSGVWDADRRGALVSSSAAAAPWTANTATRTAEALDGVRDEWSAAWDTACAAPAPVDAGIARPVACLQNRLAEVHAVADVYTEFGTALVAPWIIDGLTPIDTCRTRGGDPIPVATAARDSEVAYHLARGRAHTVAGNWDEAQAAIDRAASLSEGTSSEEAQARVAHHRGTLDAARSDPRAGEILSDAYWAAVSARDDVTAVEAATTLVRWGARVGGGEPMTWLRHAKAGAQRVPTPAVASRQYLAAARLRVARGERELAREAVIAAGHLLEGRPVELHLDFIRMARTVGPPADARAHANATVTGLRATLGDDHPLVAAALAERGLAERDDGDDDAAARSLSEAAEIVDRSLPSDHRARTVAHDNADDPQAAQSLLGIMVPGRS